MESVAFIQWCLDHLNYWTITLLMAIESSFIPFPSEVVVPPAAYKAAGGNSDLNVFLVVIFATIGANIGAIINYYIAYFVGTGHSPPLSDVLFLPSASLSPFLPVWPR